MPTRVLLSLLDWRSRFAAVREAVRLARPQALKQTQQLARLMPASLPAEEQLALQETLCRAAWGKHAYLLMQRHARQLAAMATESHLLQYRITAMQLLAQAAYDQGKRSLSLRHWLASLEEADQQENAAALCEACLGIGSLLLQESRPEQARQILQFAQLQARDAGLKRQRIRSGLLLAGHYSQQNDAAGLAKQLNSLAGLPQDDIDTAWQVDMENFRARLHLLRGDTAAAEPVCAQAIQQARQCRYKWGELQARLMQADIARQRSDLGGAIVILREALAFAATCNAIKRLPLNHLRQLADMQEGCGQLAEALGSLETWHELCCAAQADQQMQVNRISPHDARLLQLHLQLITLKLEYRSLERELRQQRTNRCTEAQP